MSKVLIISIDALDSILLSRFESDLPYLRKLRQESPDIKLTSVQPPDSDTAWASIHTGLNPAKHGIVHFIDPLDKASSLLSEEASHANLRGNTYWDYASKANKKVCILFPHLGYPVWEVNGVMVARPTIGDNIQAFPQSISEEEWLPSLIGVKGFPGREKSFNKYLEAQQRLIRNEAEFALEMLGKYEWDLFFIYSSSLDMIQHYFWRYCDENDPGYPGDNPYRNVIKDFYCQYDDFIGQFIDAVDSETVVIVLSDHGHGMRPVKLVNINEILRQKGLLVSRGTNVASRNWTYAIERMKRGALSFISEHELGEKARRLLKMFPAWRRIYTSPLSINWQRTVAHVTDMSGIKSYSYGGVTIIKENLKDMDYEEVRSSIIAELSQIREPGTGESLVNWICRREDLYSGEFITKYPDIVFDLREDYGAGWAIHDSLFSTAPAHNIVPGSHKAYSPAFLMANLGNKKCTTKEMTLMDVAPTVLDLLGVKGDFSFDGRSILEEATNRGR